MSGVYHLFPRFGSTTRMVMQRLDHAAIWLMIAGSFTPIHYILCRRWWRWGILAFVWIIAITGLVLKTVFFDDIPNWATTSLYIGLGWVGVLSFYKLKNVIGLSQMKWLVFGGLAYTVGAVMDLLNWPVIVTGYFQYHEIFHLLVVFAAASHWYFIYQWANHPVYDHFVVDVRERSSHEFRAHVIGEAIQVVADSKESLKNLIQKQFHDRFHHRYFPKTLSLRYVQEEVVSAPESSSQV